MNINDGTRALNHGEAWSLLPWLVNETLSGAEQTAVEAHVRSCLLCRRELGTQRQMSRAINASPTIRVSAQRSFASLMERVDAGPDSADSMIRRTIDPIVRGWKELLSTNQRWAVATTAAAGCLVAVLLTITTADDPSDAARYTTLTSAPTAYSNLVEVVFAGEATQRDIDAVLIKFNARILTGPSQKGVYTIVISSETGGEFDEVVRRLAGDPRVGFAGISFGGSPPDPP